MRNVVLTDPSTPQASRPCKPERCFRCEGLSRCSCVCVDYIHACGSQARTVPIIGRVAAVESLQSCAMHVQLMWPNIGAPFICSLTAVKAGRLGGFPRGPRPAASPQTQLWSDNGRDCKRSAASADCAPASQKQMTRRLLVETAVAAACMALVPAPAAEAAEEAVCSRVARPVGKLSQMPAQSLSARIQGKEQASLQPFRCSI